MHAKLVKQGNSFTEGKFGLQRQVEPKKKGECNVNCSISVKFVAIS